MPDKRPDRIKVADKSHKLIVLQVLDKDSLGIPSLLKIVHPEQKVKVEDGMRFVTAYIPEENFL